MKATTKTESKEVELGAVLRSDGTPFFNGYLWPTEDWWANDVFRWASSRWEFGYVALKDGRFCVEGYEWTIRENKSLCGRQNNFETKEAAIRTSCARMLRVLRGARKWNDSNQSHYGKELEAIINWSLSVVAKECGEQPHRKVTIPNPIKPTTNEFADLPLFKS